MHRLVFVFLPFLLSSGVFALQSSTPRTTTTTTTTTAATAASSRRHWLASTTAGIITITATIPVKTANAEPSLLSKIQSPIQDTIAPGHWIGQFLGINSRTEPWDFPHNTPTEVSNAIVTVLEGLTPERRAKLYMPQLQIQTADSTKIHVRTWTKLEWLDVLDVTLTSSKGGCVANASFYATGFLPTTIPLAPLLNVGLAVLPFGSPGPRGEMLQDFRLRALRGLVTKQLEEKGGTPELSG